MESKYNVAYDVVRNLLPGIFVQPTRGNKKQAEDYIMKVGKFKEKEHTVVVPAIFHGEILGKQGARSDLSIYDKLIADGKTPADIYDLMGIKARRMDRYLTSAYIDKKNKEVGFIRDIMVAWHFGDSGTGKTYCAQRLYDSYGEQDFFMVNDYSSNNFLDGYMGQKCLFLDEYRGEIPFSKLLSMLQGYKATFMARYNNVSALWQEVHITSSLSPDEMYRENSFHKNDKLLQLLRRINVIEYHYKDGNRYKSVYCSGVEFSSRHTLLDKINGGFVPVNDQVILPFSIN